MTRLLPRGRLRRAWRGGLALLACLLLPWAAAISYTVQVVALSDQQAALELRNRLSRQGYPVYLVSVPTNSGVVSRIRIGAFANRAAAVSFAETFGEIEGSSPVPALAEGIPTGLIPLEPALVASYPYIPDITRLQVVPWGEGVALRFQGSFEGQPMEASYRVLEPDMVERPFDAWRAAPGRQGDIVRVYNFPLWPSPGGDGGEEALEAYQSARLSTIAGSLELSADGLRDYRFYTPGAGMPYLVLAERFDPVTGENARFAAVGSPARNGWDPSGPRLTWLESSAPAGFPGELSEPLFDPEDVLGRGPGGPRLPDAATWEVSGGGWTARPDAAFTRITIGGQQLSWRALAGFPLWARGNFLLAYHDGQILLYALQEE